MLFMSTSFSTKTFYVNVVGKSRTELFWLKYGQFSFKSVKLYII